jgi:deoxyribonuclease-4
MPLFGAHMSIAGGFHKALERAAAHGMETVQLFTGNPNAWPVKPSVPTQKTAFGFGTFLTGNPNAWPVKPSVPTQKTAFGFGTFLTKAPNQWDGRPVSDEDARLFRRTLRQTRLRFPTAHDSYLINLASPDPALYRRSVEACVDELHRAEALGLRYLVTHPGAHMGDGEDAGLDRVVLALDAVHRRCPDVRVRVLLETTAGPPSATDSSTCGTFCSQGKVEQPNRLGVCLDTCHVLAAGYGLWPEAEYRATMREFHRLIGLSRLRVFHVNDSLKPLGSRVDRHAHVGRGHLGLGPFRLLVNDPRFRTRLMILETPKESDESDDMDAVNLSVLRGLVKPGK